MNTKECRNRYLFFYLPFILTLLLIQEQASGKSPYPSVVPIIKINEAHYKTPENTLAARMSSLHYKDIDWFYETLTHESAERNRQAYERAGIDPSRIFEMANPEDKTYIIGKYDYKNGIVLLGKSIDKDGTIIINPITFVKEEGLWKQTSAYNKDDALVDKSSIVIPSSILKATISVHPNRWNYNLNRDRNNYNRTARNSKPDKHRSKLLCILRTLKDKQGTSRNIDEIDQETLLLNYVVHPQPWQLDESKDIGVILENGHLKTQSRKKLNNWIAKHSPLPELDSPVMLVRFSLAEAMNSLDDVKPGKKYMIPLTGKLKDGTYFKGETEIMIVPSKMPINSGKPFWWEVAPGQK